MQKYLLDGNIFNEILADQEAKQDLKFLVGNGVVKILITWVVAEEIDEISRFEKKEEFRALFSELNVKQVPLAGLLLDRSKLDQTLLIPWNEAQLLEHAISFSINDDNDMAIAMTAKNQNAKLVTQDKRLLKKAASLIGVKALDWFEFLELCRTDIRNLQESLPNHRDRNIADR